MPTSQTRRALAASLAVITLAGVVSCGAGEPAPPGTQPAAATTAPIEGVKVYDRLASKHVTTPVMYDQSPAAGGDHSPQWTNCGVYDTPVEQARAVHSMEHGAVWLTYQPQLPAAEVQKLKKVIGSRDFVILSPHPDQGSAVTATAWGVQLAVDTASDPRLGKFLSKYVQGEQTPEPGAPCTGGVDG